MNFEGYTSLTGMLVTQFFVGCNSSKRDAVRTVIDVQTMGLRFIFDGNEYRYNDVRSTIPLSYKYYLDSASILLQVFMELGGYYAFDHGIYLISEGADFEVKNTFDGFGLLANIGFLYSYRKRNFTNVKQL